MAFFEYMLHLLGTWGNLFISPLENPEMFWILIPIYLNWIFTEFYQEKKGTSLGNAISNGVIVLWVGIDWSRTLVGLLSDGKIPFDGIFFAKLIIAILMFAYGLFIIVSGIKAKKMTKLIGRVREVTYVSLMFTPIFYGVVDLSWEIILAILVFFPLFYFIVEVLDWIVPNPKTYDEEEREEKEGKLFGKKKKGEEMMLPEEGVGAGLGAFPETGPAIPEAFKKGPGMRF